MFLYWKIRYLDRTDKDFKDRNLCLDTTTLDLVLKAAVELVIENKSTRNERDILKFRHLFVERKPTTSDMSNRYVSFCLDEYFEDETGKEITSDEMVQIKTGNPNAMAIPRGASQAYVELMRAEDKPVPFDEVSLTDEQLTTLGYFVRDLDELKNSAFVKEGSACTLMSSAPYLKTAASPDEICSFVTIFRRLYMEKEPSNFKKAVEVFVNALGDHPIAKYVEDSAKAYESHLAAPPDHINFVGTTITFSSKRLIDAHIYTHNRSRVEVAKSSHDR